MSQPLDGARLKVVRAQEHLDSFKSESAAFLNTHPYTIESEVYGQYWWVKPRLKSQTPPRLAVVIGDCVTNLRASLDYVIWELAQRYFNPPVDLSRQYHRQILTFPMLLSNPERRQGHIDHLNGLARCGIPAGAIQVMKDVQADAGGDDSLRWLYELVNQDKHRTPLLTLHAFSAAQIELTDYKGRNHVLRADFLKDGVTLNTNDPDLLPFVREHPANVNVQAAVQITFADVPVPVVPIDRMLEQIVETVANVIPRFDSYL